MSATLRRTILRWIHILTGITVIGYVYTPFEALPSFAYMIRFFFLPVLLIAGLWMWKGSWLGRQVSRRPAGE